jgi:hypothetical protein
MQHRALISSLLESHLGYQRKQVSIPLVKQAAKHTQAHNEARDGCAHEYMAQVEHQHCILSKNCIPVNCLYLL